MLDILDHFHAGVAALKSPPATPAMKLTVDAVHQVPPTRYNAMFSLCATIPGILI
jgi:hypothetical protein